MDIHFSIVPELSDEIIETVEVCSVIYKNYIVITNDDVIYSQLQTPRSAEFNNFSIWLIDGPILGPVKQLLSTICGQNIYFFVDVLDTSVPPKMTEQFDRVNYEKLLNYNWDSGLNADFSIDKFDPILRQWLRKFYVEKINHEEIIKKFLIGESFSAESNIMGRLNSSDFDALKLTEVSSFVKYLEGAGYYSDIIKWKVDDCISLLKQLLLCVPNSPSQFQSSSNQYVQDSFPCVYKINSALNYCSYYIANKLNLFNKAFMHLFRVYEYYCSGALLGKVADFGQDENYYVGKKKCLGFKLVYTNIPSVASSLSTNVKYLKMNDYIKFRNKFHYTHGDLKIKREILDDFYSVIHGQISILETEMNQRRMGFDTLRDDLKSVLFLNYDEMLFSFLRNNFFPKIKFG